MILEPYFDSVHAIVEAIYAATGYSHLFYYQNHFFVYRPDEAGNLALEPLALPAMLTLVLDAMEKLGLADAGMSQQRIVELNLLYLGLVTLSLPNNILDDRLFEELTGDPASQHPA
jgi:hypothetical protein